MSTTLKMTEEQIVEHKALHSYIITNLDLQSKKKRVRKKLFKKLLQQPEVVNGLIDSFFGEGNVAEAETKVKTETIDVSKMPVTTLLKVGKAHFSDEEVMKYYYNKNKPEYYKNKELLQERFAENFINANAEVQEQIKAVI